MARELAAFLVVALYGALCLAICLREWRRRRLAEREAAALLPAAGKTAAVLLAHATQTGQAEEIAWQSARMLHTAGVPVRLLPLSDIRRADLEAASQALFIVSTYGEGDPPDGAAIFAREIMGAAGAPDLRRLHAGILALGDSHYANFCGFGRSLEEWLRRCGAHSLFGRIDADRLSPDALTQWRHQLSHLAGTMDLPDWDAPRFQPWQLAARRLLNPGSLGEQAVHLELKPPADLALPQWQAGDLAQIQVPADPDRPREYSIASLPPDGSVHLLVRRTLRPDGAPGAASGWLTQARVGETVPMRLRAHASFRQGSNAARPLVLIGNGTGMAGLRAHVRARALSPAKARVWLIFGERQAAHDAFYREEMEACLAGGTLARLDWVFSRDQPQKRYVQHLLKESADALREWMEDGALYVCGSLEGMAGEVDAVLNDVLGSDAMRSLTLEGRYRRDVY